MTSEAVARIDRMTALSPHAVDLARLVSFAVLVEPALLRAARLELLPVADAGTEADLWFGPLVQSRNQDGIMMFPAVAEPLRAGLSEDKAQQAWRITSAFHHHLAPAVQLEEKLNWLSTKPSQNDQEIRTLLQSALSTLLSEGRDEMANWAARALPRLPEAVRSSQPASMLAVAADLRLGRTWALGERLGEKRIPDWFFDLLPQKLGKTELGIAVSAVAITFDPLGGGSYRIPVPASDPRVLQLSSANTSQLVFVDAKSPRSVPLLDDGPIQVTTLAGEAFTLERDPTVTATTPGSALVCAAYANCNQALVAWQAARPIDGCLGFALERRDLDADTTVVLKSWRGFSVGIPGASQPTTEWPIQGFRWMDTSAPRGGRFSYSVTPVVGELGNLVLMSDKSLRTNAVTVRASEQRSVAAYFNRQAAAAAALLSDRSRPAALQQLGGEIRRALLAMLTEARTSRGSVYAALWLLDDPDLVDALRALGDRLHLIVPKNPPPELGSVKAVEAFSRAEVYRRSRSPTAHHSFMVVCDANAAPAMVWTGSTIWTSRGLYGQDSNALVIRHPAVAKSYLERWHALLSDPVISVLKKDNTGPRTIELDAGSRMRLWWAPVADFGDIDDVRKCLREARSAVLFAVGPRSRRSVVDDILRLASQLYVAGVARTFDAGSKVTVHRRGTELIATPENAPKSVVTLLGHEMRSMPPVGSRLIVIDPFDERPVVITGSHFLSEKASRTNDEDLVIIEGDAELAAQCAVHIRGLIDHYALRAVSSQLRAGGSRKGTLTLLASDDWQKRFFERERAREIQFWIGASRFRGQHPPPPQPVPPDPATADEKTSSSKSKAARTTKKRSARSSRVRPKSRRSKSAAGPRRSTARRSQRLDLVSSKSPKSKTTGTPSRGSRKKKAAPKRRTRGASKKTAKRSKRRVTIKKTAKRSRRR
jgi:phosphatidylserine/phosphatidylglycerophosphate/cardiolipin synthase-like enzyme